MSKEQYTRLTTKSDNFKDEVAEEMQQRELKKYRRYIPEYYLNFYEPIDNTDINYMNEL